MEGGPSPVSCPLILTMAHTHTYNLKRYTKLDIKARKYISFDNFPREDSELQSDLCSGTEHSREIE